MKFLRKYLLLAFLMLGFIGSSSFVAENYFEISKNLEIFTNAYNLLSNNYVDELDNEKMIEAGMKGMLSSLDPYNAFYPEKDEESYTMQISGEYGGIGASIRTIDDYVIIMEPYEGSPSQKIGLKAGDKISKINGVSFKGKKTDDVSNALRGKPKTTVEVEVINPVTGDTQTFTIERETIKIKSVPHYSLMDEGVGYIYLANFRTDCSKEVKTALKNLIEEQKASSIILDLRDNPGGLLNEAINIAGLFLPKGSEIVSTKGKNDNHKRTENTRYHPLDTEIPLVVMVNENSASASEIVSGAIQDYDRGIVVGASTFGKGLVQTTRMMEYNSRLKLTTSKYYLPSGRCIQAIDYSGRYKDGVESVPDSLRTEFKTKKGRLVYDAGGIDPDVTSKSREFSSILYGLVTQNHIFDFATEYAHKHPTIASPSKFTISDEAYENFKSFIAKRDFTYDSQSEHVIKQIKLKAEKDGFSEKILTQIDALEKGIIAEKLDDLEDFKAQIKYYLQEEIISRYYYQSGAIQSAIHNDPYIKQSKQLLTDLTEYKAILN